MPRETRDLVAVGTRADLVARALGRGEPERDPWGASWAAYSRYSLDHRTGFTGVRILEPGTRVEISPERGVVFHHRPLPWLPSQRERGLAQHQLVELIRQELANSLHAFLALPLDEHLVDLTGGKDSRLLLAVAMTEGLTDRLVFRTFGYAGLADADIASELAQRFGLEHHLDFVWVPSDASWEQKARRFVERSGGIVSVWDERNDDGVPWLASVNGCPGEILRSCMVGRPPPEDLHQLVARYAGRFSQLHLLRPEAEHELETAAMAQVTHDPLGSTAPVDLMDGFELRTRLGRRVAFGDALNAQQSIRPTASPVAVRAAFALGGAARQAELAHWAIIAQASPDLASHRIAGPGWRLDQIEPILGPELRRAVTEPHRPPRHRSSPAPPAAPAPPAPKAEPFVATLNRTADDGRVDAMARIARDGVETGVGADRPGARHRRGRPPRRALEAGPAGGLRRHHRGDVAGRGPAPRPTAVPAPMSRIVRRRPSAEPHRPTTWPSSPHTGWERDREGTPSRSVPPVSSSATSRRRSPTSR